MGQAIVNIEELRREGEIGFFTNISAGLDASRGNRDRDFYFEGILQEKCELFDLCCFT